MRSLDERILDAQRIDKRTKRAPNAIGRILLVAAIALSMAIWIYQCFDFEYGSDLLSLMGLVVGLVVGLVTVLLEPMRSVTAARTFMISVSLIGVFRLHSHSNS